jgi:hypothetical protein
MSILLEKYKLLLPSTANPLPSANSPWGLLKMSGGDTVPPGVIFRILRFPSATYTFPLESTAKYSGATKLANAPFPSIEAELPDPASVVTI